MNFKRIFLIKLITFSSLCFMTTSCDSTLYSRSGAFTDWPIASRNPASAIPIERKFKSFQDPKQVLIYCHLNSKKERLCYNDQIQKVLSKFKNSNHDIDPQNYADLINKVSFDKVKKEFDEINNEILSFSNDALTNIAKKRSHFCNQNSKNELKKCLTHFLEKDTFTILNNIQKKYKMNGPEYLYLKKAIQIDLKAKLKSQKI